MSECRPCEGLRQLTPRTLFQRAGLTSLNYRVGDHASFLSSMLAALSQTRPPGVEPPLGVLAGLRTREANDPSIAMLDAWAVIADVLTFYQERLATESFLNTATQQASLHELARLLGYAPRPGLSASVFLSFQVDDRSAEVLIPRGTKAQSTPVPGSNLQPQVFETSVDFVARAEWNVIRPRLSRPQDLHSANLLNVDRLYFQRTGLQIKPNDYLVLKSGEITKERRVKSVEERNESGRGRITIATLFADTLSVRELVEAVSRVIDRYTEVTRFSYLLPAESVKFRSLLQQPLEVLRNPALQDELTKGLIGADSRIYEELVQRQLNYSDATGPQLVAQRLYRLRTSLDKVAKRFSTEEHTYQDVFGIRDKIDAELAGWLGVLTTVAANLTAISTRQAIWSHTFLTKQPAPIAHIQFAGPAPVTNGEEVFKAPEINVVTNRQVQSIKITTTSSSGITIDDEVALMDEKPLGEALKDVLATVKRKSAADPADGMHQYASFIVSDDQGFVTAGTRAITFTQPYFKDFPHDWIKVVRNPSVISGYSLDDFSLSRTGDWKVTVKATLIEGDDKGKLRTADDEGDDLSFELSNIATQKNLQFVPTTSSFEGIVVAQFEVVDEAGKIVALQTRTLVVLPESARFSVPASLAKANTIANTIGDAKPSVEELQEQVQTFKTELLAVKLVSELDKQLRKLNDFGGEVKDILKRMQTFRETLVNEPFTDLVQLIFGLDKLQQDLKNKLPPLGVSTDIEKFETELNKVGVEIKALMLPWSTIEGDFLKEFVQKVMEELAKPRIEAVKRLHALGLRFISTGSGKYGELQEAFKEISDSLCESDDAHITSRTASLSHLLEKTLDAESPCIKPLVEAMPEPRPESVVSDKVRILLEGTHSRLSEIEAAIKQLIAVPAPWGQVSKAWDDFLKIMHGVPLGTARPPNISVSLSGLLSSGFGPFQDVARLANLLGTDSGLWHQALATLEPEKRNQISTFLRSLRVVNELPQAWILRETANVFGWNAPTHRVTPTDPKILIRIKIEPGDVDSASWDTEANNRIFLDGKLSKTAINYPLFIKTDANPKIKNTTGVYWARDVAHAPRTRYGVTSECTRIEIEGAKNWWEIEGDKIEREKLKIDLETAKRDPANITGFEEKLKASDAKHEEMLNEALDVVRTTKVYCSAELLELADELLVDDSSLFRLASTPNPFAVEPASPFDIVLDAFYLNLVAGMTLVLRGIPITPGITSTQPTTDKYETEVLHVVGVRYQRDENLHDDAFRSVITLAGPLQRDYYRETVEISANVVDATHGETLLETLGSGEARQSLQSFELRAAPLSRLPAADADGQEPALELRVNQVEWERTDRLLAKNQADESYELRTTREGKAHVQFGDGWNGARLPTGTENVKAKYRRGLGLAGNVDATRIDQLPAPPPGVKGVSNPVAGDGGADPDDVRQSKLRIPRSPIRAGRLISRADYESFALLFAGVEKAKAIAENGAVRLIVAGPVAGPLRTDGKLMQSLVAALARHGDPQVPCIVTPHTGKILYIRAALKIDPRVEWDQVQSDVRTALVTRFGYREAQLGQDVAASKVVATMQRVRHVAAVTLTDFFGITPEIAAAAQLKEGTSSLVSCVVAEDSELCYVADSVDNTIVLERQL